MKFNFKKNLKKCFTLIELIVVLTIMGTLSAVVSTSSSTFKSDSERTQKTVYVQSVQVAVNNYYSKNSYYPCVYNVQPSKGSYAQVDVDSLINDKYLQYIPGMSANKFTDNGQFFSVDYNGIVTLQSTVKETFSIQNGAYITTSTTVHADILYDSSKASASKPLKYTLTGDLTNAASFTNVSVSDYSKPTIHIDGINLTSNSSANSEKKNINLTLTYSDGSTAKLDSSILYSVTQSSINGAPAFDTSKQKLYVTFNSTNNSADLDWSKDINGNLIQIDSSVNVTHYEIDRSIDNTTFNFLTNSTTTSYSDNTISSNKTYYYRVYACFGISKSSNYLEGNINIPANSIPNSNSVITNLTKDVISSSPVQYVNANITDAEGVDTVKLFWKVRGDVNYTLTTMQDQGNSLYSAPIVVGNNDVLYYIAVVDKRGNVTYDYKFNPAAAGVDDPVRTQDLPNDDEAYFLIQSLQDVAGINFMADAYIDNANSQYYYLNGQYTLP